MENRKGFFYLIYSLLFLSEVFLCASFAPKFFQEVNDGVPGRPFKVVPDTIPNVLLFFVVFLLIGLALVFSAIHLKKENMHAFYSDKTSFHFAVLFSILNVGGLASTGYLGYLELTSNEPNNLLFVLNLLVSVSIIAYSTYFVWDIHENVKKNIKRRAQDMFA